MTSKQEFHEQVAQVLQAENITLNVTHGEGRTLTFPQRKILNDKVNLLSTYGEHGGRTWQFLHDVIWVKSIKEMRQEHNAPANAILDLMIERAELKKQVDALQPLTGINPEALNEQVKELQQKLSQAKAVHSKLDQLLSMEKQGKDQAVAIAAKAQEEAQKKEILLSNAITECRLAKEAAAASLKRRNRQFVASVLLGAAVVGEGFALAAQARKPVENEVLATTCSLDGKAYEIGDAAAKFDMQCVKSDQGATWKSSPTKQRRPR